MKTRSTIIISLTLLIITSCIFKGDCEHKFVYQGSVHSNNKPLSDSLIIRFENLGDIIFDVDNRKFKDSSFLSVKGNYRVNGGFLTACASDEGIFDGKDSITYELVRGSEVIKTGKYCINNLDLKYIDSSYLTVIKFPTIKTN